MRPPRLQLRLVVLMASIASLALGLAALRRPDQALIDIALTSTVAAFLASALQARFAGKPGGRAWWFGFSLFGWAHLLLVGSGWRDRPPTTILAERAVGWYTVHYGPYPTPTGRGPWYRDAAHEANSRFYLGSLRSVELYLTLVAACVGALLTTAYHEVMAAKYEHAARHPGLPISPDPPPPNRHRTGRFDTGE